MLPKSHKIVYTIYVIWWAIMAINPKYPADWLLENLLVFLCFPLIIWLDRRHHYTLPSIILLLIFASFHSLGSHYTYSEMEHFNFITEFFGFERNHYDRLVHFLFGFLLFHLFFEMIAEYTVSLRAALLFTLMTITSISTLYEIVEWLVAITLHPELGHAFLGSQGDIWDAQKDTVLAMIGATLHLFLHPHYKTLMERRKPTDV